MVRNVSRVAVVHPTATLSPVHVSSYRANADMLDRQDLMRPVKAACNNGYSSVHSTKRARGPYQVSNRGSLSRGHLG